MIALITWLKVHPFLALIIGSAVLGLTAGFGAANTEKAFIKNESATRLAASGSSLRWVR